MKKMKKINLLLLGCLVALAAIMVSCNQDEEVAPQQDITQEEQLSPEMGDKMEIEGIMGQVRSIGFGGPTGFLSEQGAGISGKFSQKMNPISTMRALMGKSDINTDEYVCVEISLVINDDGSHTWIVDFGDGCDFFGRLLKGKVSQTFWANENSYTEEILFEDFGGENWMLNGTRNLNGTYEEDDSTGWFTTTFSFVTDVEILHEGEVFQYDATGVETLNRQSFTVEERVATLTLEDGSYFNSLVLEPVVWSFACEEEGVFIFVAGLVEESYTDAAGELVAIHTVDFGDGECDNIVTIEGKGITIIIDLGEFRDQDDDGIDDDEETDG